MISQKQLSKKIDYVEYPKYSVTNTSCEIEAKEWKEGTELEVTIKNGKIVLRPKQ